MVGEETHIDTAQDPYNALEIMKNNPVDLVFADVDMPGMNGLRMSSEIHAINPNADIVFATRYPDRYGLPQLKDMIMFGGSPRASINLAKAARAYAFIKRRGYVVPEDVRAVAHDVLRHRIGLTYEAEANNTTAEDIVSLIINKVEVP